MAVRLLEFVHLLKAFGSLVAQARRLPR